MPRLVLGLLDGTRKKIGGHLRRLNTRAFREALSEVVEFSEQTKEPLVLTRHDRDRAALVSIEDLWIVELTKALGSHEFLVSCESTDAAVAHLAVATERYINQLLRDNRLVSHGAQLHQLALKYKPALTASFVEPAASSYRWSVRDGKWSGTHLIAAAHAEACRRGLDAQARCSLLSSLMYVAKEAMDQIPDVRIGAVDDMHAVVELFETTAMAIRNDQPLKQQFANDFAEIVCASRSELARCLLVWCIGEITERGAPMMALARQMAEALLAAHLPDDSLQVLHMLCENDGLAKYPPLARFCQSALSEEQIKLGERVRLVSRSVRVQASKRGAFEGVDPEALFSGIGELLADASNGSPLTMILGLGAIRRILKHIGRGLASNQQRAFVEASCHYVVNRRRNQPTLPVFLIAETLEAVRDPFKEAFSETMANIIDVSDPQLMHAITVCVAEGVESELAASNGTEGEAPRFEIRPASGEGVICVFHPGNMASAFAPFWVQLAECISRNPQIDEGSAVWVTNRLNIPRCDLRFVA